MRSALASTLALALAACSASGDVSLEWGVGGKADGLCDETAPLCWPTRDLAAAGRIESARIELGAGDIEPGAAAAEVAAALRQLDHKLEPGELEALDDLEARLAAGEGDAAWPEVAALAARVEGLHMTARAVALGRAMDVAANGKGDDVEAAADLDAATDDLSRSLARLEGSGVAGRVYGTLLEMSGALDGDYPVLDRDSFAATGPSREERVEAIIARRRRQSGLVGLGTGAIDLIPGFGIFLSIPLESAGVFALHARMAFEIAGIYGWDIHRGDNLDVVAMMLISDGELAGFDDDFARIPSLPALLRALGRELGLPVTSTLATRLTATAIAYGVKVLARRGEKMLAAVAAEKIGEAALEQVLHWASLGLGVIASGVADYYVTGSVGDHVALLARPWLVDLPIEGTAFLATPERRRCHVDVLGALAAADGSIAPEEQQLFEVFAAKPFYLGDGRWTRLSDAERDELRGRFETASAAAIGCAADLEGEAPRRKLIALSHYFGIVSLDGAVGQGERALYGSLRDLLDGDGWFDGPEIDPLQIDFVERAVTQVATSEYDLLDW